MTQLWPALVNSRHSEKPSIIKLLDDVINKLHKNIETTEININVSDDVLTQPDSSEFEIYDVHIRKLIGCIAFQVHDKLVDVSESLWAASSLPRLTRDQLTSAERQAARELEEQRNAENKK